MLITTTQTIPGKSIRDVRGIVFGEAVQHAAAFSSLSEAFGNFDRLAGMSYDERLKYYNKGLMEARAQAMEVMERRAANMGANAIVAVDVSLNEAKGIVLIGVSGTAVVTD